jgi:nitrite reductase/ring-hydroxylating ferredoxin subunit
VIARQGESAGRVWTPVMELEDGKLTCWRHPWEFDARTGAGINPADSQLTRYPCLVDKSAMICVDVT